MYAEVPRFTNLIIPSILILNDKGRDPNQFFPITVNLNRINTLFVLEHFLNMLWLYLWK